MSAMIGSFEAGTISFSASAAWWWGPAARSRAQPASARAAIWFSVALTSRVSVLVMVWTAIGAAPPTTTSPTRTGIEYRLFFIPGKLLETGKLVVDQALDVEVGDHGDQREQRHQPEALELH